MIQREPVRRVFAILILAVLVSLLSAVAAGAFSGGNHGVATGPALAGRTSADAAESITNANKAVDDNPTYNGADHFDRNPGKTNAQAFQDGAAVVRAKRDAAIAEMKACHTEAALKLIGEALHTLQDFYSHSNFVDMSAADQAACEAAIQDPSKPVPAGLKLNGYDPNGTGTGKYNPSGDSYEHGLYSGHHKDNSWTGDGNRNITKDGVTKTAFEWAMEAAQKASKDLIDQIIAATGIELWNFKFASYTFPPKPASMPSVPIPPFWSGPFNYIAPLFNFNWYRPGTFGVITSAGGIMDDSMGSAIFAPFCAVTAPCYASVIDVQRQSLPCDWYPPGVWVVKAREVRFDGGSLVQPVVIGIKYDPSELGPIPEHDLRVYEFDLYRNALWSPVGSADLDMVNDCVTFQTDHLGTFCIGGTQPIDASGPQLANMPDGTPVGVTKNVTLAPRTGAVRATPFFYVEDLNRLGGLRIENSGSTTDDVHVADAARIDGVMATITDTGERYVQLTISPTSAPGTAISTLGVGNRSVGTDKKLIGELVTAWGIIRSIAGDKSYFTMSDGCTESGVEKTVKVVIHGDSIIDDLHTGDTVAVVGVVSKEGTSPSTATPVLLYRGALVVNWGP